MQTADGFLMIKFVFLLRGKTWTLFGATETGMLIDHLKVDVTEWAGMHTMPESPWCPSVRIRVPTEAPAKVVFPDIIGTVLRESSDELRGLTNTDDAARV